ncbi:sigma-70 family RNA polymerase sigma factor [Streptomyces sp. NRRL F-525]|uniref:sigma-70 family RNA polymerase sigma factor n=1 Tax=Streptomyces sp. NRRL F-525 TaxID=1463861 RepID=UPI000AD1F1AF|nr:sigma-70 family RNA polymerase sigma factor [Streptomyces sp. NRRL F-525]
MRAQSIGGAGVFGVKAALVELLTQLRHAAVNGVVPEHAFAESVRTLELGDAERERLRDELARMGLLVQGVHVHTDADSASAEKVARFREENMFPRVHAVRGLLSRYADAEGYVTARAVDGVARLAGLDANEAVALRAEARLRPTAVVAEEQPEELEPAGAPEPLGPAGLQAAREAGDLAAAEAAALAVLEEDRFRRRPEDHLLSAEAEVGLAVLVRGGPSRIGCEPEKAELSGLPPDDIRVGARNCLVVHNQRLAHSILRGYLEQGLEYDDLFQHGVLGLMTAARKFDPTKGYKFSTYATWWVRQAITRAVADEGAVIRIPVHMHEQIRKVARAERTLNGLGKPASSADVAVLCDISLAKVEEARRLSRRTDSLDRVVGDGVTLGDFVGFRRPLPSVEGMVLNMLDVEEALAVLDTFSGRDHRILVRRLGLDGDEPSTLDELGREFGVTRERIRQIESKLRPVLKERLRTATHFEADRVPQGEDAQEGRHRNGVGVVRARNQARLRVAAGAVAQPKNREVAVCADPVPESAPVIDVESAPPVPLSEPDAVTAAHAALVAVPEPGSGAESCAAERYTCDWEEARRMTEAPVGDVNWLAKYALTAVGHVQLAVLLGQSATDAVMRSFQVTETVDPPVVASLEVLRRVFDALIESRHRPEDFFERPAEVLVGTTPRAYLAAKPLVYAESRLAMRDALREFMTEMPRKPDPAMETEHAVEVDGQEAAAEASLTEVRRAHEAYVEQLRQEHRQQLDAERQTAALRIAAAGVDAEAQLDALEDALLLRMDKSLLRRERSALAQAEERIACSEAVHREAYQTAMQRADGAEKRLRQYREDAEAHIAALEVRLRQSESKLAQQDQEVRAARQEAQDAEQRAAQRIAKTERDAWARITELQEELAVERGVANGPSWLRDHRRPS